MSLANIDKYPLLKSRVKAHQRRTKTGKVVQVSEHEVNGHKGFHHKDMKKLTDEQHRDRLHTHYKESMKYKNQAEQAGRKGDESGKRLHEAKSDWHNAQRMAHDKSEPKNEHDLNQKLALGSVKDWHTVYGNVESMLHKLTTKQQKGA